MMTACCLFLVAMEVFFSVSDAQIIISDPTCSMVSKASFYEQVEEDLELLSQFASVIDEIRTVSFQNRQDVSILTDQVSTLYEIRANNENNYAKITSDAASTQTQLSNVSAKNEQFESVVNEIRTMSVQNRQDVTILTDQVSKLNEIQANNEKIFAKITSDAASTQTQLSNVSAKLTAFSSRFESLMNVDVRLVDGGSNYGRVKVYIYGQWCTVCDDSWDNQDARVVCRMLGHSGGIAKEKAFYGEGSGNTWLDNVSCTGSEASIFDCNHNGIGKENCSHSEDAGVVCT